MPRLIFGGPRKKVGAEKAFINFYVRMIVTLPLSFEQLVRLDLDCLYMYKLIQRNIIVSPIQVLIDAQIC